MSPIRTSLLLAAPHFQIRNLPIANLHRQKKTSSKCTVFSSLPQCFNACRASMDVSHIRSYTCCLLRSSRPKDENCKKTGFLFASASTDASPNASIASRIASIASIASRIASIMSEIASIASRIALIASLIASIASRTASNCVKCVSNCVNCVTNFFNVFNARGSQMPLTTLWHQLLANVFNARTSLVPLTTLLH